MVKQAEFLNISVMKNLKSCWNACSCLLQQSSIKLWTEHWSALLCRNVACGCPHIISMWSLSAARLHQMLECRFLKEKEKVFLLDCFFFKKNNLITLSRILIVNWSLWQIERTSILFYWLRRDLFIWAGVRINILLRKVKKWNGKLIY